jgi:hypothetical protein
MVTGVEESTSRWVTENVAVVWPARTVTVAGTVAADVVSLERVTTVSLAAAAERVTVPVTVLPSPPVTLVGLSVTLLSVTAGGVTVNVAVWSTPLSVAVIVTGVGELTAIWVTAKVAVVWLARTVTLAGTVAADVVSLASVTTVSLAAAPERVTVPVTVLPSPPVTLVGLTVTLLSVTAAGPTVNVAVRLTEPIDAVIVTGVEELTAI